MPLSVSDLTNTSTIIVVADFTVGTKARSLRSPQSIDFRSSVIRQVEVGGVLYPLRKPFTGRYHRYLEQLIVEGVSPQIVGRGESENMAKEDFCLQIHSAIQDLLAKRPFEFTDRDKQLFATIDRFVDVTVFRNTHPIQVRQFGKISKVRPFPEEIEWENGTRDLVPVSLVVTPEYVNYKLGQPIEAIVQRDPMTFRLRRIIHINKCKASRCWSTNEEAEFMDSIGSSNTARTDPNWRP
ncbi:MAG: hypothetical protein K9M08_09805 [Pirellula sp.]|nr:hypothetical protein [Pirellula sp.]